MSAEPSPARPPLPETPMELLGDLVREKVILDDRTFTILRPEHSDRVVYDRPRAGYPDGDRYVPYWADLWPAARMLAKAVLREPWPPGTHALEVGCGLGLPGVAALAAGLRVTFSDYDATALRFAADSARANGFADFDTLQMDWRYLPPGLQFPVILASDLLYELANVAPLVTLVRTMLTPGGVCLLTDQDRVPAQVLKETLGAEGLTFTTQLVRAGEPGGRRVKGTLYRIGHRG